MKLKDGNKEKRKRRNGARNMNSLLTTKQVIKLIVIVFNLRHKTSIINDNSTRLRISMNMEKDVVVETIVKMTTTIMLVVIVGINLKANIRRKEKVEVVVTEEMAVKAEEVAEVPEEDIEMITNKSMSRFPHSILLKTLCTEKIWKMIIPDQ